MSPAHLPVTTFIRPRINLGYGDDWPDGINTLPELIEFAAKHNPEHIFGLQARPNGAGWGATWGPGNSLSFCEITFSQLRRVIERASVWLVNSGATTGRTRRIDKISPVAIFLNSDVTIFIYMAALLRIGSPTLVLSARLPAVSIVHLLRETQTSAVLTSIQLERTAEEARALLHADDNVKFIHAPTFFDLDQQQREFPMIPHVYSDYGRDDLDAIILHTSGTTGLPKPVYHAQAYVLLYGTCHRLPPQREPFQFNVSTLPLYHGFGLLAPCLSLSIGLPFVLLSSSMIPTARSTLMALRVSGARYMLTVPSIVEDIMRSPEVDGLEMLRQLEILAIGGAPMKESIVQELFQAKVNVLNHWGATEIGPIVPIERPQRGYDGRYLVPRTDINLAFVPTEDTFRLAGRAPGWKEPYIVQDLLLSNPRDRKQFRILGRADELLVLATGEKVRPAALEREISRHPCVKDVLAFGDGKFELGIIIELEKGVVPPCVNLDVQQEVLLLIGRLGLDDYIQRGNTYVEGYGKVAREMVVLAREDDRPLQRTEKGSLARKENYTLFEKDIKKCYERLEVMRVTPMSTAQTGLRPMVKERIQEIGVFLENDSMDFFDAGMDSLQAMRLRRVLLSRLGATESAPHIAADLIFANPSVDKLCAALQSLLYGNHASQYAFGTVLSHEERRIAAMEAMAAKYKHVLASFRDIADLAKSQTRQSFFFKGKNVVLLTGSTGNLGCFLLAHLARHPDVSSVICLNRPGSTTLRSRQLEHLKKHGISLSKPEWAKINLYEGNLNRNDFRLGTKTTEQLSTVTHIIHNAWPVNFSWSLSSFEPHIRGFVNLMQVALESTSRRADGEPTRLMFTSSIAVVANYPLLNRDGPQKVPECSFGPTYSSEMGYAEAKWVCEDLAMSAAGMYDSRLRCCCARIGQISGSEGSGVWNEREHFPVIIQTSCITNTLPLLQGSFSWIPLNRAASTIVELLFSQRFLPTYHVENPSRHPYRELMETIASILRDSQRHEVTLVDYSEWLAQIRELGTEQQRNPAYPLLSFFDKDFLRLATGEVVLDTTRAREESITLTTAIDPLHRKHLLRHVMYWQSSGALS